MARPGELNVAVEPMFKPDGDAMLRHLEHLFGGFLDGKHDGLIEIAWTNPYKDAKGRYSLKNAQLFGTDNLEEAVALAIEKNVVPNQDVYVGATLRKPDTAPFARGNKDDFYAAPLVFVDLDDDDAGAQAKTRYRGCPPTCVVITGRTPNLRAQLWWRLEEPITDIPTLETQNKGLIANFAGDKAVFNADRVMRLAGSIAWPKKAGRVVERTELNLFADRPPVALGRLAKAFPPVDEAPLLAAPQPSPGGLAAAFGAVPPPPTPSTPTPQFDSARGAISGKLSTATLIAQARSGHKWHDAVLKLTGHLVVRGSSNAEIIAMAEGLTLQGYTVDQTRAELREMIDGARRKWARPNQDIDFDPVTGEIIEAPVGSAAIPILGAEQPSAPFVATKAGTIDPRALPRREWVLGQRLIKKFVTVTLAPPGVGKSTLTMQEMVAVAMNDARLTGDPIHLSGPTWIYNGEDPLDELQRRLAAIMLHWGLAPAVVGDRVFLNSGRDRRLIVAREIDGAVVQTPDVETLIEQINTYRIAAMTVDPFVRVHRVSENANEQIDIVADLFAHVADRTGCAINLVHHTRKAGPGTSGGTPGDLDAARGASALGGAARVASTLLTMSQKDAEDLGVDPDDRRWYVRLDDAKASMSPPADSTVWFKRVSVELPNTGSGLGLNPDHVGVLERWTPPPRDEVTVGRVIPILQEVQRAFDSGEPYTGAPQSPRYLLREMTKQFGMPKGDARALLEDWKKNGVLITANYDRRKVGFKVGIWPGSEVET
jgi:hypothetical protein